MPRISSKNQITLPVDVLAEAGLKAGDDVAIEADGAGKITVRRRADFEKSFGIFSGLYPPDYLEKLRARDRY